MDAQRALLDELMGRNRDGDKPNEEVTDYRDARVCKKFLCGLCPHDLFQNTKMDMNECTKLHLPKLRDAYEQDRKSRDLGYEHELERDLIKFISDVEKKISRAQRRLEEQEGAKAPSLMDVDNCKEVLEITAEIQETMLKAEEAGNEGEVDLSMELMEKVEELKQKKAAAQTAAMIKSIKSEASGEAGNQVAPAASTGSTESGKPVAEVLSGNPLASTNVNQKLRVCDVCGAFLSIFDSDRRLADHFGGKLHLGYLQIRKKIEEIAEMRRERRRGLTGSSSGDNKDPAKVQDRNTDREKKESSDRRRRRSRSPSRSRSRPRRDDRRDRSRGRRREGSRERTRDRKRDRDRDHRSSRRRSRRSPSSSRSRSRSRSRGRRH